MDQPRHPGDDPTDASAGPLVPGARLGRSLVIRELEEGPSGVRYAAYDPELDRRLVVELSHGAGSRALREARAMTRVSHPNVVAVHDAGTRGDQVYRVMEAVEGTRLTQWLAQPRDWREIVQVFLGAGEGLYAAHEAGLVHGDFAPGKVIVTPGGVAKVTDFGLSSDADEPSLSQGEAPAQEEERVDALIDELAGFLGGLGDFGGSGDAGGGLGLGGLFGADSIDGLGEPGFGVEDSMCASEASHDFHIAAAPEPVDGATPAFMAPEQFRGEVVDARADQFSFCVALHLALWGVDPGGAQAQAARERGDVPAWIGAVVDRGLAQDSNERWPSMVELLAALRDDPAARRRRWGAVAMAVTVAVGVGLGAWQVERERVQSCAEVSGGAAQLWGEARQAELRAAMLATDTDYAEDTWARVSMRLDEWSHDWASARAQTCGRPDAAEHARCLDAQLVDAEALVDVVGDSERANLAEVLGLVASLPEPQLCERPAYRAVRGRSALDGRSLERRAELARVWALRGGGRHGEALARARALLESIERDREGALWSEASVSWGRAALSAGDYADAREGLEAGYFAASGSGLDRVAFEASVALVELATERAEFELGALWVRQAEVLAERMGDAGGDRAAVAVARGRLLARAGELEAAESVLDEAAEAVASSHAPGHPLGARVALERGELARAMGEHARSRRLVEGARTTLLTVLGGSHPHLVEVELALARIERDEGDLRGARSRVESALERQVRVHGREHPAVVETLVELAVILVRQGSVDEAREREAEARAVAVATMGRDHPRVAWIGDSLAAEMRRGLDE